MLRSWGLCRLCAQNINCKWWMISFTPQPLNPREPFDGRLGDPYIVSGSFQEQNHSCLCQESNHGYAIPAPYVENYVDTLDVLKPFALYSLYSCHFTNISKWKALLVFRKSGASASQTIILVYSCLSLKICLLINMTKESWSPPATLGIAEGQQQQYEYFTYYSFLKSNWLR
jgi:hypothetical protein